MHYEEVWGMYRITEHLRNGVYKSRVGEEIGEAHMIVIWSQGKEKGWKIVLEGKECKWELPLWKTEYVGGLDLED